MFKFLQGAAVLALMGLALGATTGCAHGQKSKSSATPEADAIPGPEREFRGVWVATVANIDWPSEPNLPVDQQKAEAIAILDRAASINLNAIVFQGRPACDAMYPSNLEPWSYYLTGKQGKAPEPAYDPLEFWVEEAHKRGLELHVWFNPYRAQHPSMKGEASPDSVVKKHPELAKKLAGEGYYWLDPSKQGTQDHSIAVVMDVVKRYDIDGVHFDDYFYPYPEYNKGGDFPDDDSWAEYQKSGGKMSRSDWRRDGVNKFMERLYGEIKAEKKYVQFGLSPFGIWRPGHPPSIQGFDQHEKLYADAKLWLNEGWVDYYTPQLYWPVNKIPQSYPVLLGWWAGENHKGRNLWPGLSISGVRDEKGVDENINQIMITRGIVPGGPGNVHFSMKGFMTNRGGLNDGLLAGPYAKPALAPRSPWLDDVAPDAPKVSAKAEGDNLVVSWEPQGEEKAFRYVVYIEQGEKWRNEVRNRDDRSLSVQAKGTIKKTVTSNQGLDTKEVEEPVAAISRVAVSSVDRLGNESAKTIISVK